MKVSHDFANLDHNSSHQDTMSKESGALPVDSQDLSNKVDSDVEDVKRSDSSDDDLNLTSNVFAIPLILICISYHVLLLQQVK